MRGVPLLTESGVVGGDLIKEKRNILLEGKAAAASLCDHTPPITSPTEQEGLAVSLSELSFIHKHLKVCLSVLIRLSAPNEHQGQEELATVSNA